jgi:serine/threonine-protein kinase RsbT
VIVAGSAGVFRSPGFGAVSATVMQVEAMPLRRSEDIVRMRQVVRERAVTLGFGLVDQTEDRHRGERARPQCNPLRRRWRRRDRAACRGSRARDCGLTFIDQGPGIDDIQLAMKDGFTSGSGLGLGLGGARRLTNEFALESSPGSGTRVTIIRWR